MNFSFHLSGMGSKNDLNMESCNVNLTLHLQNDIHSGFWIFNRKGVGMVKKSRRQNVYLLKVHIQLSQFMIL